MTAFFATPKVMADQWLCTEVASQRSGNVVRSCGVGMGDDENSARRAAFDNAKSEFTALCDTSDDCRHHAVTVQPERTSCEPKEDGGYKCYRLLIFSISEDMASGDVIAEISALRSEVAADKLLAKVRKEIPAPVAVDPPVVATPEPAVKRESLPEPVAEKMERPKPFRLSGFPKIKLGMTKADALEKFGRPDVVRENEMNVAVFYKGRRFCDGRACMFRFERETGRIITYQDFRHEFTEAMN